MSKMISIENNCKNYTKFERIGEGSYANIYKAQNKTTNSYVAIKEIDKRRYKLLFLNSKYHFSYYNFHLL